MRGKALFEPGRHFVVEVRTVKKDFGRFEPPGRPLLLECYIFSVRPAWTSQCPSHVADDRILLVRLDHQPDHHQPVITDDELDMAWPMAKLEAVAVDLQLLVTDVRQERRLDPAG